MKKRRNISKGAFSPLFHNIINISLTSGYILFVKCDFSIYFFPHFCLEVQVSQSISESPLNLEVMRVNCLRKSRELPAVTCIGSTVCLKQSQKYRKMMFFSKLNLQYSKCPKILYTSFQQNGICKQLQTQIRILLHELFDQDLHCWTFHKVF